MARLDGTSRFGLAFGLLCLLPAAASGPARSGLTGQMWADIAPIYRKTLDHPFLRGLTDGKLPKSRFQFYLIQDGLYLRAFGQALNLLAAKAPREEWSLTLSRHAIEALETERQLHDTVLQSYGVTAAVRDGTPMAPANAAYTNHLLATVHLQPFAQGLAAMLPCYWIYWEVGKELKKRGSRDPDYQRWIDQYAGEEYGQAVRQVLDMMDAEAGQLSEAERRRARALFERSARYEWLFWDMAWREERWLP
jgi:thiaminase/transcriptional activator TenA